MRWYGTVLLHLERRRVVDLLPERSKVAFALSLRRYPEVRLIRRDRDQCLRAWLPLLPVPDTATMQQRVQT